MVDIDGDGSFLMNVQELATVAVDKLAVKMMIINNQHLGMVVQWEDRFYKVWTLDLGRGGGMVQRAWSAVRRGEMGWGAVLLLMTHQHLSASVRTHLHLFG